VAAMVHGEEGKRPPTPDPAGVDNIGMRPWGYDKPPRRKKRERRRKKRPVSRGGGAEGMALLLPGGSEVRDGGVALHAALEGEVRERNSHRPDRAPRVKRKVKHNALWGRVQEPHPLEEFDGFREPGLPRRLVTEQPHASRGGEQPAQAGTTTRADGGGALGKLRRRLHTLHAGQGALPPERLAALGGNAYFTDAAMANAAGHVTANQKNPTVSEFYVRPK